MSGNKKAQTFRDCLHCGNKYGPLDHLKRKFCSRACHYAHTRISPFKGKLRPECRSVEPRKCLKCGEEFILWGKKKREKTGFYCSHVCYLKSRRSSKLEDTIADLFGVHLIPFERQVRIAGKVADFLLPGKLIVEVDGDYWHSLPGIPERDKRKDEAFKTAGYELIRLKEKDINRDKAKAVQVIINRWESFTGKKATKG